MVVNKPFTQQTFNVMYPIRLLLFIGLLAAACTSCKKDSNDFEGLRVTINGDAWTAPTATGASFGDNISITGADPTALKSLLLLVPANITAGTYTIEEFGNIQCSYNGGLTSSFASTSGKLVITEHNTGDKRIKGTFEFEAINVLSGGTGSFTEGEFNVVYQ